MSRRMDDMYEVPARIVHRPLCPPRAGTPGEGIYLELWQDWVSRNPREWAAIFDTNGPVRQRAASVAASFITFMGCNGGLCFTRKAEQYATMPEFYGPERAFVAAWAVENMRNAGVNHGLRISEYMLARRHPIDRATFGNCVSWKDVPDVTQEDNDYLESMVRWWSGHAARVMRSIAEPMIDAAKTRRLSGMFSPTPSQEGQP
jgi:hypothetical protein